MIKTKTAKSLSTLEHDLDLVFSQFIAFRDYNNGWKCFICGVRIPSKAYGQVCHFIPRAKMPTRYDEMNCHFGCIDCNCYDKDHESKYRARMIEVYLTPLVDSLERASNGLAKFMRHEIQELIDIYTLKVKELRKEKGL